MVELLKKIVHKSLGKLCSVQTINAKCGMYYQMTSYFARLRSRSNVDVAIFKFESEKDLNRISASSPFKMN